MNRREFACGVAEAHADESDMVARLVGLSDGVVVLLRDREEVAFKVLEECQEVSEEAAIGPSKDRGVWCVVCPEPDGFNAAACRIAEEMHLFEGLDSPLAADAGITTIDRRADRSATIAAYAANLGIGG